MSKSAEWPSNALKLEVTTPDYTYSKNFLHGYLARPWAGQDFRDLRQDVNTTITPLHTVLMRNGTIPTAQSINPEEPKVTNYLVKKLSGRTATGEEQFFVARTLRIGDNQTYILEKFHLGDSGLQREYNVGIITEYDPSQTEPRYDSRVVHIEAQEWFEEAGMENFHPFQHNGDNMHLRGFDAVYKNAISDLLAVSIDPTPDDAILVRDFETPDIDD